MKKQTVLSSENKLYYGDNLEVLRKYIKDETIDLCYIDPPFNSKRNYNQIYNNIGKEDKAQAQAFVDTWIWDDEAIKGYDEIINNKGGKFTKQSIKLISGLEAVLGQGSLLAYLVSMTLRIAEIHRVLKPTGSFYFHCDHTASHYIKIIIDAIFCIKGGDYQSEIVWRRTTAHGNAKQGSKKFEINFDTIFFYTKGNDYVFNTSYMPFKEEQIEKQYNKIDSNGRRYRYVTPTAAKGGGDTSYEFHGVKPPQGRFWAYSKENMDKFYEEGKLYFSNTGQPYIKYYLDERPGVAVMSFWDDIKPMSPMSKERLGYPTQKPEALLARIIEASTNKGDIVLDAYCGCGTTIAVAQQLKRKWIGIYITYQSISLILRRLTKSFGNKILDKVILNGVPEDMESAIALANKKDDRIRKEFEKWAVLTYSDNHATINEKKGGDGGIDGTAFMADYDDENKQVIKDVLFSVKSGKNPNIDTLRAFAAVIDNEKAAIGYYITLYPMPNLVKESKKFGTYKSKMFDKLLPKITVVTIEEILKGARIDLPQPIEVVKSAEAKTDTNQITLF